MRRWAFLCCGPLLLGCANRGLLRYDTLAKRTRDQDFLAAADFIHKNRSKLYGHESDLLYDMDLGLLYNYAGRYDSSIVYLENAVKLHDELYTHSVTNEAVSLLTNDNMRPYRGHDYEITWLHLFLAFDYLALNREDDARVEARQAQLLLDQVKRDAGSDPHDYRDDGLMRTISAFVYASLGENDDALIALYQAVKAYRDAHETVPPELERAAAAALWANGRQDDVRTLGLDSTAAAPSLDSSEIVVVGLLGRSPTLGQTVFWGTWERDGVLVYHYQDADGHEITNALPAPGLPPKEYEKSRRGGRTLSGTTLHIKWAMPELREVPSRSRVLRVAHGDTVITGEPFADTRALLQQALDQHQAATLARTVTRVVLRTIASQETKSKLNSDNPLVNLLVNLGIDFFGDQLEQADTRVWFLLPRTVQLAYIPAAPGRYTLDLSAQGRDGTLIREETVTVDVKAGQKKFVFFTSLR